MKSAPLPSQKKELAAILLAYIIFAAIFGFAYRYAINPDGVSQLRLAGYIAEGNFLQSVTSSWSPLFIWLISPFLFFGFDGLAAARIVIALSGAGLVLGSWLLTLRIGLSRNSRFIAVLIAALLISDWTVRNIGADLPVAALTIFYIYLATHPDILIDRKISFFCGIAGGFSYLAHHYALPFFLAHYPLMLLLRGYIDRDKNGFPVKKVFMSLAAGVAGLLIISSIWIGIVSVKYGHLAISSKGSIAHAAVGPKDKDRRHPFFVGGLYKPRDAYAIHVFEDPSEVEFKTWSPFESREYFMYQLKLIKDNAVYILNHFVTQSPFFTYAFVIGILTLIPIAFLLNPLNNEKRFLYLWVVITFGIYCSGYLLVIARSPRRFYALMIVFLFISFHFLEEFKNGVSGVISGRRKKILIYYLLIIVVPAFALKPGVHLLKSAKDIVAIEQVNPYKEIAGRISAIQFPPPYAIIRSSQKPHTDTYIAYYLKKQLLGRPLSRDVDGITKELEAADAKSLLVFDNPEIVEKLKKDKRYIHAGAVKLENSKRYLNAVNIKQDEIKGWDKEVNVFILE
ncbi:MAG TPA: hypothetical protein ENH01_06005 [Nitrospirae bacterium]|nr:hypothetical protein [Nitrospirota bacterium]